MIDCPPIRDRLDLPRWLVQKGLLGEGAEIGVLFGEFSAHLLEYWPGKLYMVDPWVNQSADIYLDGCNAVNLPRAMEKARKAVEHFGTRAQLVRKFSEEAAIAFNDNGLDFAYLDGNHAYESACFDIRSWWRKVKVGGVLGGHDYYDRHDEWQECGVKQAVDEFCAERGLKFYTTSCTSWWVEKT